MKNRVLFLKIISIIIIFFYTNAFSKDQFDFNVTELEITNNGNKIKGYKRGTITTDDGIEFNADQFDYDKLENIFNAIGNIDIIDEIQNFQIFTDNATYYKNEQIISTKGKSKAIDKNNNITIEADNFNYNKLLNIFNAKGNVKLIDKEKNITIYTDSAKYLKSENKIFTNGNSKAVDVNEKMTIEANDFEYNKISNVLNAYLNVKIIDEDKNFKLNTEEITYLKNDEIVITRGLTSGVVEKKYNFNSKDLLLDRRLMILSSLEKSTITDDKKNYYEVDEFKYNLNTEFLKGKNVKIITNINSDNKSDEYFFSDSFIDLKNQNFKSSETKIKMNKDIFGNTENDPRIYGASSSKKNKITTINKAIFTSCKINDDCPPWSMKAKKITHDDNKRQLIYDDAILKVYNLPVLYFPKFFHPDPSVERQSGFLQPQINNSDILGTSTQLPYFHAISATKDYTFTPAIFDSNIYMLQNEYRQETENSTLIADFSLTKGYKSELYKKKNSISHLFSKFYLDLNFEKFKKSDLNINIQKVTNDTYLKLFDSNLIKSLVKPSDKNKMTSEIALQLDHENYNFDISLKAYEELSGKNSDRYQFVIPSYNFSKDLFSNPDIGIINFESSGDNNLINTNNLKSRIYNDFKFSSKPNYFKNGFENNYNFYLKNINTVAKNDAVYKSSPQSEIVSIFETETSLPLVKYGKFTNQFLTPKISLRINPSDMKENSGSRKIDTSNLFSINRLGISDGFEPGQSLTFGIDYKREKIDTEQYLEFKVGTVLRDKVENKISNASTIDKKFSNIIGSIYSNLGDMFEFNYNYSFNTDEKTLEYNSLGAVMSYKKFETELIFVEENGNIGDANTIVNNFSYKINDSNYLTFGTRRNRKIGLTEYYDLLYEYRNDCLIAGIKYNKKYYKDRDVLPTEDLLFTITLFPLTTYEKSWDRN